MLFKELCSYFQRIDETTKRLEMTDILKELLTSLDPSEIGPAIYMSTGELGPKYDSLNTGVRERFALKIFGIMTNVSTKVAQDQFNKIGDVGDLFEKMEEGSHQQSIDDFFGETDETPQYSILEVWAKLVEISKIEGGKSENLKVQIISEFVNSLQPREKKYFMRILIGKTRLGAKDSTWLDAAALLLGGKDNIEIIDRAYYLSSNIGRVIQTAVEKGLEGVKATAHPEVHSPIQCMTAKRASSSKEVLDRMISDEFLVETKYDGYRIQIHIDEERVSLWSRNQESYTDQFPDIVSAVREAFIGRNLIVEGEVVAFNQETQEILNFQALTNRRRKYDIKEAAERVQVRVYLFDILYLDDEILIDLPLLERRRHLENNLKINSVVDVAEYSLCKSEEEIEELLLQAKSDQSEGIMVKDISSSSVYEPGKRSFYWIKFKADYIEGLLDSFDLAIVGAFAGKGKRGGKFGTYLMAAWDPTDRYYKTFCRLGAGFSDEDLDKLTETMNSLKLESASKDVISNITPDIWVEPKIILEVSGAEISDSPIHTVPAESSKMFLAIRFPRYTGKIRDDKSAPDGCTTIEEIWEIRKSLVIGARN